MSGTAIFVTGLFAFLLLALGLVFTVYDIRKSVRNDDRNVR